jgi:predicted RND superfamily exporter protein
MRRAAITLVFALAGAVLAVLAVRRLTPDTSMASLFGADDPAAQSLVHVLNNYRSVEELLLLVESKDISAEPAQLLAFARRLDAAIRADQEASELSDGFIYRADEQSRAFFEKVLVPNALFYLDEPSFQAALKRLSPDEIGRQIRRNETLISTPGPAAGAFAKAILQDPLRLHEFLLDRLASLRPLRTYGNSHAFISPDGRALLIRIRGRRPVSDLEFCNRFTAAIRGLADRVNTGGLRIEYSGAYAIAAVTAQAIRRDMISSVISSVVLLQLLFLIAFRRPFRSFFLAFAPVVLGILFGFAAYAMLSRTLNPMTAVIGGVLAGMSIDYAIAFISYYQAGRASADSAIQRVRATRRAIGPAILAAWATSVAGFIAIGSSRISAMRDFSLLGSLALTGAFLCAIFVLPSLLVVIDRSNRSLSDSRLRIESLLRILLERPAIFIALTGLVLAACTATLLAPGPRPLLVFESDLSVLHPHPNPPLEAQSYIARRMGTSPGTMLIHLRARTPSDLLPLAHTIDAQLRGAAPAAAITGTFGLATLLPDPHLAAARISATGPAFAERVIADFRSAISDSVFDPAAVEPYVTFLRQILTATRPPEVSDLLPYRSVAETILPSSAFVDRAPAPAPAPADAITLVFLNDPTESRTSRDAAITAIRTALAGHPGVTLTGLGVLSHDAEITIRRDLPRLIIVAAALAAAYLIVHFRNPTASILAMLPTVVGFVCLLAFMRLSGQRLNMINLAAFPLLIGIDVDYGIFIVSAARLAENRPRDDLVALIAPGAQAVVLCAATTILGFGSLAFTSIPAVRSLGLAVAVGVATCLLGALFLVVPILFTRAGAMSKVPRP